ncbi:2-oxo-4-hydroxy-4-carboxy-5-ureidoimidazoline decarboxylase-like [Patiria miniata]|uniref:2-oxo-4-hydroxy-4-carboxy-5-ureidoimidazoline decarboxylase n=1 Tax=Patiria miniata TaxID=46514 RepID=A0A914ATR1_PATMI|nr:2-oxo-4-hydroxy-4-carboxy-5-ureidoimidazoline decarboxylase-like [Patiria miniata]
MDEVNSLSWEAFIQRFGNVIEHGPIVAGAIWTQRPFSDARELHRAVCGFLDTLPSTGKESILRCHPDLAGALARADRLTTESKKEQRGAGLLNLTKEEAAIITELNISYKSKFQFPFVICARENKKEAIIAGLKARINNTVDVELQHGIGEVKKIAWYRILDLVPTASDQMIAKY